MSNVDQVLNQRKNTHGNFIDTCATTQALMQVLYGGSTFHSLSAPQVESLHMIAHKMARIVNGDPNFEDHWIDIEGYSKLVRVHCIQPMQHAQAKGPEQAP